MHSDLTFNVGDTAFSFLLVLVALFLLFANLSSRLLRCGRLMCCMEWNLVRCWRILHMRIIQQLEIRVNVALVLLERTAAESDDLLGQSIQEVAVVRYHDHRSVVRQQCFFEHFFRQHIEVVRRLVKDEQVVWL